MSDQDGFEATFIVETTRTIAWQRLTGTPGETGDGLWLAGFDARAEIIDADEPQRLSVVKRDEPCAGTGFAATR
jgi:hypothetical protein